MTSQRKAVLSCGLGRFAANDPNAQAHFGPDAGTKTLELLETSIRKANEAGFDIVTIDANPKDPDDTLKRLMEVLRGQDFAGVNIGYGVRGHKDHTELFEKILNLCWAIRPGVKIMFSNGPHEVITAIQRSFPESFRSS